MKKKEILSIEDIIKTLDRDFLSIIYLTLGYQNKGIGGLRLYHYRFVLLLKDDELTDEFKQEAKSFFGNDLFITPENEQYILCNANDIVRKLEPYKILTATPNLSMGFGSGVRVILPKELMEYKSLFLREFIFVEKCIPNRPDLCKYLKKLVNFGILEKKKYDDWRYKIKDGNEEFLSRLNSSITQAWFYNLVENSPSEFLEKIKHKIEKEFPEELEKYLSVLMHL